MLPKNLTEKQKKILEFIVNFVKEHKISPTTREIAAHFNIAPKNVLKYLKILEEKGYIKRKKKVSRGIILPEKIVPVTAVVRAGYPSEFFDQDENEFILIDPSLFPYQNLFIVKVMGDSMINAHIEEGDIAVCIPCGESDLTSGDIVVVSIYNELTLKRFLKKGEKVILHPENDNYEDIVLNELNSEEIKIFGKVVGIIRRLK